MSIEKAIQKLKEEIIMKEMTIEAIEKFNEIDMCDQLKAIKESYLRYDKEFRENWVKEILNYKGYIKIDSNPNGITIFYPMHTLYIPTHNYDGVIVEEIVKIREPIVPDDRHKKLLEAKLEATEKYKQTPSFAHFKKVLELEPTKKNSLLWWLNKVRAMQIVNEVNIKTRSALNQINKSWERYHNTLETNTKIRAERKRIEKELMKDFQMFEQNNLKVYKKY